MVINEHHLVGWCMAAAAAALVIATAGAAQPSRAAAAKMQIAIHETWRGEHPPHYVTAKFTIESRHAGVTLATLGSGTAIIRPNIGPVKYNAFGQETVAFTGSQVLTSKNGVLQLSFSGNTVFVNSKFYSSAGQVLSWDNERGTWRITNATGVYQGWKGGGRFASVDPSSQLNSEWDGFVTH